MLNTECNKTMQLNKVMPNFVLKFFKLTRLASIIMVLIMMITMIIKIHCFTIISYAAYLCTSEEDLKALDLESIDYGRVIFWESLHL